MKNFTYLLICASFAIQSHENLKISDVSQLIWENRILIIWSYSPEKYYQDIMVNFSNEIDDRDIKIFLIDQSNLVSNLQQSVTSDFLNKLHNKFPRDKGRYFLIGKDGGLKNRGEVLDLQSIFSEIDRMPMRKMEIKSLPKNNTVID